MLICDMCGTEGRSKAIKRITLAAMWGDLDDYGEEDSIRDPLAAHELDLCKECRDKVPGALESFVSGLGKTK